MLAPGKFCTGLLLAGLLAATTARAQSVVDPAMPPEEPPVQDPAPAAAPEPPPPEEPTTTADSEVEVATRTPLTTRDAPGVVTLIQREEIEQIGARDLLDILQLVPGFSVAVDVEGVVDVGFRGLWGHEGKVLFLLDGQELNETLYSTMQLGMHVPASIIERVEVVRGPGSAVYGGSSELAVVNVITRDARTLAGAAGSVTYGQMNRTFGHIGASASYAARLGKHKDLSIALHLAYSDGNLSDRTYQDFAGKTLDLAQASGTSSTFLDLALGYKGLKARFIYDDYQVGARDGFTDVLDGANRQRFESFYADVRYEARLGSTLTLIPKLNFKRQAPWQVLDGTSPLHYDKFADRALAGLQLVWAPLRALEVVLGAEAFLDRAQVNGPVDNQNALFGTSRSVDYENAAGYAQVLFRNFIVNVIAGARYEYNSHFGSSFVPRVGLTKVAGRFSMKLLYSQAFRAPSIENLNLNPAIQPERTNVLEAEIGYQVSGHLFFSANGYWIKIERPIIYDLDQADNTERYFNADRTGTVGAEGQMRVKYAWGFMNLSYSYYRTGLPELGNDNRVALYAVPGDPSLLLAFPAHKVALSSAFHLWRDHLTLGLSGVALSDRRGYLSADGSGNPVIGTEPATLLVNTVLTYHNLLLRGLDLSVGAYNLLDSTFRALQPYNAGHAPLPLQGREVMVRLTFRSARID